jgi:uncharacterized membrane protein YdjX (TVP38/TMEM64 family)
MLVRWWSLFFAIAAALLLIFFAATGSGIALLTDPAKAMGGVRPVAAIAGVLLLVADVFLPVPSSLIMVANGAMFGLGIGTALSMIGSVASALTAFAAGRAGNDAIRRLVTPREHARAGAMLARWGVVAIAVTRPVPILAETVAILAGSSPLTWRQTAAAAAAGSLVPAAAYAWAGAHAQDVASPSVIFLGVLAVTALMAALVRPRT